MWDLVLDNAPPFAGLVFFLPGWNAPRAATQMRTLVLHPQFGWDPWRHTHFTRVTQGLRHPVWFYGPLRRGSAGGFASGLAQAVSWHHTYSIDITHGLRHLDVVLEINVVSETNLQWTINAELEVLSERKSLHDKRWNTGKDCIKHRWARRLRGRFEETPHSFSRHKYSLIFRWSIV